MRPLQWIIPHPSLCVVASRRTSRSTNTYLLPCGFQTIMDLALVTLPVDTATVLATCAEAWVMADMSDSTRAGYDARRPFDVPRGVARARRSIDGTRDRTRESIDRTRESIELASRSNSRSIATPRRLDAWVHGASYAHAVPITCTVLRMRMQYQSRAHPTSPGSRPPPRGGRHACEISREDLARA